VLPQSPGQVVGHTHVRAAAIRGQERVTQGVAHFYTVQNKAFMVDIANPAYVFDVNPVSLLDYFVQEFQVQSPFINAFLHGTNLVNLQRMMTHSLKQRVDVDVPLIGFSDAIISQLMYFALTYRLTWVTPESMARANQVFVDQFAEQNEGRYYETAFWKRWCSQGLPDPNNIPLPLDGDRPDFTVETDGYLLNNPIGYKQYPRF